MLDTLTQTLNKARAMTEAANTGSWDEVTELQKEYVALIAQIADTEPAPTQLAQAVTMLEEVQALEAQVNRLASTQKDEVAKKIRAQSHASRATSAYAANTGHKPGLFS